MTDEPVTREEFLAYKKVVAKHIRRLDGLVSDCFQAISDSDSHLTENVDEAIDKADRAQRAVRRLKKEFDAS